MNVESSGVHRGYELLSRRPHLPLRQLRAASLFKSREEIRARLYGHYEKIGQRQFLRLWQGLLSHEVKQAEGSWGDRWSILVCSCPVRASEHCLEMSLGRHRRRQLQGDVAAL